MAPLTAIPCFTWTPSDKPPHAVLLCIHGLGLYGGTYHGLGQRMAREGVATYALDVRGFGRWQTESQCLLNLAACLDDVRMLLEQLRNEHPGLPLFVLGESLGGAIATAVAANSPQLIDGLVLSAPARIPYDHKVEVFSIMLAVLRNPCKPICISATVFKHAPHVVRWQENDPLIRLQYSARELIHLAHFMLRSFGDIRKLRDVPVLVVQGHADTLIRTQSTVQFFQDIPASDKELVVLGGAGHLIFQSLEVRPKAVRILHDWLADHAPVRLKPVEGPIFKQAS